MTQLSFETRVEYDKVLIRKWARDKNNKLYKAWKTYPIAKTRTGIVVGIRRLTNGYSDYIEDVGNTYQQAESLTAYLVAWNMHRKIDLVLPEDIRITKEQQP